MQVYSSIRKLKDDLVAFKPDHFVCVPLVLDTLHTRCVLPWSHIASYMVPHKHSMQLYATKAVSTAIKAEWHMHLLNGRPPLAETCSGCASYRSAHRFILSILLHFLL